MPDDTNGCHKEWNNPHEYAFIMDMTMLILTMLFYRQDEKSGRSLEFKVNIIYLAFVFQAFVLYTASAISGSSQVKSDATSSISLL
jgi:hypothetical protein